MNFLSNVFYLWGALGKFRLSAVILLGVILIVSFLESVGVWLILPVLELALNHDNDRQSLGILNMLLQSFNPENYLLVCSALLLAVMLVKTGFSLFQYYFTIKFATDLRGHWEVGIFDHYLHARFENLIGTKHGKLLNNILYEPILAEKAIRECAELLSKTILCVFVLVVVISTDWKIALGLLALILTIVALFWSVMGKYSTSIGTRKIELNQEVNSQASQFLTGIRQVKIFSFENEAVKRFTNLLRDLFKLLIMFAVISKSPKTIGEFVLFFVIVAAIIYGHYFGDISITAMLPLLGFFLVSFQKLFSNFTYLVSKRMSVLSYLPSLRLVEGVMYDSDDVENATGHSVVGVNSGNLALVGLAFEYDRKKVFDGLNLELAPGKITALVGPSGSGKSTICDLITRFYSPTAGCILYDGIDISSYSLGAWRKQISYVSQDTFLFDGTVRDNLLVAQENASEDELLAALDFAQAMQFVNELPGKLDAVIGNNGVNISGGQRQRLAIARCILRPSNLLILDEATSSLDSQTESKVFAALKRQRVQRTTIVISHNMSTLKVADNIIVFDKGKIVEHGSYDELLEHDGLFSHLSHLRSVDE